MDADAIVIGGGLAGLVAACELCDAGLAAPDGHALLRLLPAGHQRNEEVDPSMQDGKHAEQQVNECCLARTVWAEQCGHPAAVEDRVYARKCRVEP